MNGKETVKKKKRNPSLIKFPPGYGHYWLDCIGTEHCKVSNETVDWSARDIPDVRKLTEDL